MIETLSFQILAEFRIGKRGVVHRGRRGVPDGKAIDRAQARRGVDDGLDRVGHAGFIRRRRARLKAKFFRVQSVRHGD